MTQTLADELERLGKRNALDLLAVRPTYRDGTPEVEGNIDGWMVVEVPPNDDMFSTGMSRVGADFVAALVNNLPAIIAALRALEWQPIETAPRDGTTHVIVWPGLMGRPLVAIWEPASRTPPMMRLVSNENHDHDGYWRTAMTQQSVPYEPTHWRPLPAPPAQDKGEHKP